MTATLTPSALDLRNVRKTFGGRVVLDVDRLVIAPGEVHALLGQNGSGKSTLIKILSGYHEPDPQEDHALTVAGSDLASAGRRDVLDARVRFVHQDLGLVAAMSVLDNLFLGRRFPTTAMTVRSRAAAESARAALGRVGLEALDLSGPVVSLSPAERTGVAIARALATDDGRAPDLLVLDEPTATLPAPDVASLMHILRGVAQSGVGILYVTHHLDEVFDISTHLSVLRDGVMVASGPTEQFTRERVVHHLVGSELEAARRSADGEPTHAGGARSRDLLVVDGLVGERLDGVTFSVGAGEVVGFHGLTGSGRDTLLGTIFGARPRAGGSVSVGGTLLAADRPDRAISMGVGLVPADRKALGCHLDLTATENLTLPTVRSFWSGGRLRGAAEEVEARAWFSRLDIRPGDGTRLPMSSFSGGNQQKIVLAKWLRQDPLVLLLDDPTQGVDIGAKAILHRTILESVTAGLGVVIASSDVEEMAALCTTVHIIHRGKIVDTLTGDEISEPALDRRLNTAGSLDPADQQGTLP